MSDELPIVRRLRNVSEYRSIPEMKLAADLICELVKALEEAIDGWEEGSHYKGDYLREKHGDAEGIAEARAVLDKARG